MKNLKPTLVFLFITCVFNLSKAQQQSGFSIQEQLQNQNFVDRESSYNERTESSSITYSYNDGWTPSSPLGLATSIDNILIETGTANISVNTICSNITVSPGAALTIDAGVTLRTDVITLNSTSQEYSSLICDGSIVGLVTYNRYTSQIGTNDLISAPISGQLFPAFAGLNLNLASSGTLRAFAPYDIAQDLLMILF